MRLSIKTTISLRAINLFLTSIQKDKTIMYRKINFLYIAEEMCIDSSILFSFK